MTKAGHRRAGKPIGNPFGLNTFRSQEAFKMVAGYRETAGYQIDGTEDATSEVLVNLAHLCDREGLDLGDLLGQAQAKYEAQTRAANATEVNGAQFARIAVRKKLHA